ncbi:MAG: hypothetical protein IJK61_07695, partial [Bacteroidetes bacterium]|nr:hypothetical protein [Bacteroidota bacterium]
MQKKLLFIISILLSTLFYNNLFAENTTLFVVDAKRNLGDFYVITSSDSIPGLKYISYSSSDDINSDLVRFNLTTVYKVNSSIYNHFSQRTIMWNKMELDLTKDFLLDLELQFSDTNEIGTRCWSNNDSMCKGGMGIAFVMIPKADTNDLKTYIGSPGKFLGAIPFDTTNGIHPEYGCNMPNYYIALEFDTYCDEDSTNYQLSLCDEPNSGKPKIDHIALVNDYHLCHYPLNSVYEEIDTNHYDVKASSDIYCVRIKWFKSNNKYKLYVYVKNKMTQDDFNLRYIRTFDSLGQVIPTLSQSNSTVNWGIAGGAESEQYSSTQRVIFKNLIVDNDNLYNTGVYINKHFANSLSLYLVNQDNTKQFLYPTVDDCCGYNLRHFENSYSVCIEDIKEIRIGHTQEIEYLGLKINWYDENDSLLESNNNVFNLQDYKKNITDKNFILRAEIEKVISNQGYPDTVREDLYFHIKLKNNYFAINDTNCIYVEDSMAYYFRANPSTFDKIKLSSICNYEFSNIDSSKFITVPFYDSHNTKKINFRLKDSLDICETEFVVRRHCSDCSDIDSLKIKVYTYNDIRLKDIRILKSCSGPKIQIKDNGCLDMLEYGIRLDNDTCFPIIDNQL